MSQPFENLPTTPTADEVVDKAFSRAARAGGGKSGWEAQRSMLQTAANIVSDNLENVVRAWPDFSTLAPFYVDLADAVTRDVLDPPADEGAEGPEGRAGVDALRGHLNEVDWAGRKAGEIRREYEGRLAGDSDTARKLRKQAFARIADVVEEVAEDLQALNEARDALRTLPDVRPDEPTIAVAGYPNVGKSSFVNAVTRASNEIASYPFTTTGIHLGHVEVDRVRYQLIDTPGLLDRPAEERNEIESQAVSALEHAADAVVVLVDASGTCGYPLAAQLELRDDLERRFEEPVLTVCNKADLSRGIDADQYMSITEDDGVEAVLEAAVAAVDYELELPYEG